MSPSADTHGRTPINGSLALRPGDLLGCVGTTGSAPKDTPHLPVAVYRLTPEKQWWKGDAVNPYRALVGVR